MANNNNDDDRTESFAPLTKGTKVGHYTIVSKIGAGGMGEVFLADDTELKRQVALKFLPYHFVSDETAKARFKREAQATAKLNHPNIVTIYEVSEYLNRPFIAMECCDGKPLRDIIREIELSIDDSIKLVIQLCEGLDKAHSAGIVHRDIKPSNIVIGSDERAKLLDFGLATIQGTEKLTQTGSTLGTIGYMSPEQINVKEIDQRSDLFSLGVVLYEMITGKLPFKSDTEAGTLHSILNDTPEPLSRYKSNVPDELQQIVTKLLEKNPAYRYQSAAGVLSDLKRLSAKSIQTAKPVDKWNRYVVPSALVVVMAILLIWKFGYEDHSQNQDKSEKIRLVVLPFENLGDSEDQYFADGITDEITSLISEISDIGVISRTSAYAFKDSNMTVTQIGKALDVQYVLEGTIRWDRSSDPGQIRIIPQLIDTRQDEHLWSGRFERDFVNVFEVQTEIAEQIVGELGKSLTSTSTKTDNLAQETDPEAYRHYLRGVGFYKNDDYLSAREALSKAIAIDSAFVKAYAYMSSTISLHYLLRIDDQASEDKKLSKWFAERAVQMQPNSVIALRTMGEYYRIIEFDYDQSLYWYQKAIELDPEDALSQMRLAVLEWHFVNFEEAYHHSKNAMKLDPANFGLLGLHGQICFHMRKYDEAISAFEDCLIHKPKSNGYWAWLAHCVWQKTGSIEHIGLVVDRAYKELPDFFSPFYSMGFPDIYDIMTGNLSRILERRKKLGMAPHFNEKGLYLYDKTIALYSAGPIGEARIYADSVRAFTLEKMSRQAIDFEPVSALKEWPNQDLAFAYAILGDSSSSRKIIDEVLGRNPLRKDGLTGSWITIGCAELLTVIGDYDRAVDILEEMLEAPTGISAEGLAIDPSYILLRDNPRFQALIKKYERINGKR